MIFHKKCERFSIDRCTAKWIFLENNLDIDSSFLCSEKSLTEISERERVHTNPYSLLSSIKYFLNPQFWYWTCPQHGICHKNLLSIDRNNTIFVMILIRRNIKTRNNEDNDTEGDEHAEIVRF